VVTASLTIRWLPALERASAARIWTALEERVGGDGLASSWTWTGTWLEHFGDLVPHRFAIGEVDGESCAIALVTNGVGRRLGPLRVRSVHLGTAGEPPGASVYVEYNRILADPAHHSAFAAALLTELRRDPDWHELCLDGFAPGDAAPFLAAEPRLVARTERCATTDLRPAQGHGGDVLSLMSKGTRKKVRRSLRDLGDVEGTWAESPEQALGILSELVELHQRRWTRVGEPGAFADPRFAAFHRALVARLARLKRVVLYRVQASSGIVGCTYGFIEGGRVLSYQGGLASYADPRIRPGFVVELMCMQACYDRGLLEYDLLAGDSLYKRELSTGTRELVWASWRRPALRWTALEGLAAARRSLLRRRRTELGSAVPGRGPETRTGEPPASSGGTR
jgi:CelD/BcsL family acetyltransferase involved in cellulose biosynthesis